MDCIKPGFYKASNGCIFYLANNNKFYYKDPLDRWFVLENGLLSPTKYQSGFNLIGKKSNEKSGAIITNKKTGVNFIVRNLDDIYKLDFELTPEENTKLINDLMEKGLLRMD